MKFAYWVILALVIFNFMIVMTNNLGVFNSPGWDAQGTSDMETNYTNVSQEKILSQGMGLGSINGISIEAIVVGTIVVASSAALAWLCRSPVPLGIGCFAALYSGVWVQTYGVLTQFDINGSLLAAGTVGLGIMVIISAIEMMTGGHTT